MFTGIIDHCGKITGLEKKPKSLSLWVESQFTDLKLGESIAVDGVCLTVAEHQGSLFRCDISPETQALTLASSYQKESLVNLERALLLSERLGGHFMTGHVDQTAEVSFASQEGGEYKELVFKSQEPYKKGFVFKKGSIGVNGVSLTINACSDDTISVLLIPHTLQKTNLQYLKEGDKVNLEFDWLAKIVSRHIEQGMVIHEK